MNKTAPELAPGRVMLLGVTHRELCALAPLVTLAPSVAVLLLF